MGKKSKVIKVVAPQHVSSSDPLVVSFAKWQDDELPREVTVEVVDIDKGSDDSTNTDEDVVVRFTGTLVATEGQSAQLENIKILSLTSPARCSDRVWIRFANQSNADVVEAGIPFSPFVPAIPDQKDGKKTIKGKKAVPEEFAAYEGSFYELAARVRDGHGEGGTEIVTSDSTAVRQRAFLLLAVEPLAQIDSSMTHAVGQRILETYHPQDSKKHQPRNWGGCVIRFRSHDPMTIEGAGCSYVMVTMLLRYLRVDQSAPETGDEAEATLHPADPVAAKTMRLWDTLIRFDELSKQPQYQPRFHLNDLNPGMENWLEISRARYKTEKEAFAAHFKAEAEAADLKKNDRKALLNTIGKFFAKQTKNKDIFVFDKPAVSLNVDPAPYFASRAITAESYIPLLVWFINAYDGRDDEYTMRLHNLNQHELVLAGASDYTSLSHEQYEQWVPNYKEIPFMDGSGRLQKYDMLAEGTRGTAAGNDAAILVPLGHDLVRHFGLVSTVPHSSVNDFPQDYPGDKDLAPWQRYLVATLDRGLPVLGCFSPGQYSLRDQGGHFCMIVGYRYRVDPTDSGKKDIRFIINDPGGGLTFQYEAHDERELNPEDLEPTAVIKDSSYLKGKYKSLGMERERQGLNLIIERRKRLSLRELHVYEPCDKARASVWETNRHARFLFYKGKLADDID